MFDYTLVPGFLDMNRGFAWLDIRVGSQTVRVVTTHVEAFFYDNLQPYSIRQVQQLIHDLGTTTSALIVMGDFNNDPHDPIATGELNTGDRLVASDACPQQAVRLTLTTANALCNTYWMMRQAGYRDVGPDSLVGQNDTWGYRADLAGPALDRLFESALQSNVLGLTARLDYVFVRNGATTIDAHIVGNDWPTHGWRCVDDAQRQHSAAQASLLDLPFSEESACAASDHAGVVATIRIHDSATQAATPPYHFVHLYGVLAIILGGVGLVWSSVRRRSHPSAVSGHPKNTSRRRDSA